MATKLDSKSYHKLQAYFFATLLIATLWLAFFIFRPYFSALLLAITLAVIFEPLHRWLLRVANFLVKNKNGAFVRGLAALITVIIVLVIVMGPLLGIGVQLFGEIRQLYSTAVSSDSSAFFNELLADVEQRLGIFAPNLRVNFNAYLENVLGWLSQYLGPIFSGAGKVLLSLFLSLLAFYYLLKDGAKLRAFVIRFSPLPDGDDEKILKKLESAVNSVIRGAVLIALIQGVVAGIGFTIFGVPSPTLWGSFTAIAALIPNIGTSLVTIPAVIFLLVQGNFWGAVGLAIWAALAVGMIDNVLGPMVMQRSGVQMHPFVILLSVLGGITFFGPIGFLVGPLVISFLFALLEIYTDMV